MFVLIRKTRWLQTENTQPFANLALEEQLLSLVEPGEIILYLWQNRNTVVIGRNQNCWRECRVAELEAAGGFLARRLSGGGAVYHDLGNLNFTFLMRREDYDVPRQLAVIVRALASFGLRAEPSGRNDLTIDGRKFSGNAFLRRETACYHHGTLLLSADMAEMSRWLRPSAEKLQSKGVPSVRARVCNLTELCPDISVQSLSAALLQALAEEYGSAPERIADEQLPADVLAAREARFASWEWRYGADAPMDCAYRRRFSWGGVELDFWVQHGLVQSIRFYTDAMDETLAALLRRRWEGQPFGPGLLSLLDGLEEETETEIARDIKEWMREVLDNGTV